MEQQRKSDGANRRGGKLRVINKMASAQHSADDTGSSKAEILNIDKQALHTIHANAVLSQPLASNSEMIAFKRIGVIAGGICFLASIAGLLPEALLAGIGAEVQTAGIVLLAGCLAFLTK